MNTKFVINFDGLSFLDKLETIYRSEGMEGVIQLVENQFPIGRPINLSQRPNQSEEEFFMIEGVVVSTTDPDADQWSRGDTRSGTLIRSIQMPYVDSPFEIAVYGRPFNAGITTRDD